MKRPIKPFVVEVRKGQKSQKTQKKKTPVVDLLPVGLADEQPRESDALRRAEAALFGGSAKADTSASGRSGRILETIPLEEPEIEALQVETKRQGRPPGSRNKPKELQEVIVEAPAAPKRRGRPPRILEGSVRKVELTPELANAALESIARAGVTRPLAPIMSAQKGRAALSPGRPKREPRPEKPEKSEARQAKLLVRQAKQQVKEAKSQAREAKRQAREAKLKPALTAAPRHSAPRHAASEALPGSASPAPALRPVNPLDTLPRLIRLAMETAQDDPAALAAILQRPRAGERWRRRLRGAAFFAYERRQRKTSAAPR